MLRAACNYCFCAMKTYMHMHTKCGQTCSHSLLKFYFLFFIFFAVMESESMITHLPQFFVLCTLAWVVFFFLVIYKNVIFCITVIQT